MQTCEMNLTVLSTAVLAVCIASVCRAQAGATFTLLPKVLQANGTGQNCPSSEIQQSARNEIQTEIQAYICSCWLTQAQLKAQQLSHANRLHNSTQMQPLATTGFTANGSTTRLYCDMSAHCGQPGWAQVAFINMSDSSQSCPSELAEMTYNGVRVCQQRTNFSCDSVSFTVPVSYSNVCGRIIGYQIVRLMLSVLSKKFVAIEVDIPVHPELIPLMMSMLMVLVWHMVTQDSISDLDICWCS